jgi:hypothetical protein
VWKGHEPPRISMMGQPVIDTAQDVFASYLAFSERVRTLQGEIVERMDGVRNTFAVAIRDKSLADVDSTKIGDFLSDPITVERIGAADYLVTIPQFLNLHCGWLIKRTRSHRVYRLNTYSIFGSNGLPEWLKVHVTLPNPPDITIEENGNANYLIANDRTPLQVMEMFPNLVDRPDARGRYLIKDGAEALFLVRMLLAKYGLLLQKYNPVNVAELNPEPQDMILKPHQAQLWSEFVRYGRVGGFLPPRAGKSYTGLYACKRIKGLKLVVVPTILLQKQWEAWITEYAICDTTVKTYQGITAEMGRNEYTHIYYSLVVFDESHRCPAVCFRKVACLDYKYSLGLSASPFREDGNEAQIYALTGKPVFCDWGQYFAEVDVVRPKIKIVVCETEGARTAHAKWLATRPNRAGRTLLFVEHIKMGEFLSASLRAPFYHAKNQPPGGDIFTTTEYWRQLTGKPVDTVILSRIGDEGLKIDGLRRVIVVESLGDSRRQEIQRLGRLLANGTESEYVMLLTREERITQSKKMDEILSLEGFVIEESVLERMP